MSYTTALITGYIFTVVWSIIFVGIAVWIHYSPAHILRLSYRHHTRAVANLLGSEHDESGVYTATYFYSYLTYNYEYVKHYFNEEPAESVELVWSRSNPGAPTEVGDVVFDTRRAIREAIAMILIAVVLALFLPQAIVCLFVFVYCMCRISPNVFVTVGSVVAGGFIGLLMFSSLLPVGWDYGHEVCGTVERTMPIIDQLTPYEVCNLYYDWHHYDEEYRHWKEISSIPVICQFGDSWYEGHEYVDWPVTYHQYTDWKFRDQIEKEYENANP